MMRPRDQLPLSDNSVVLPPALLEFSNLAGPFFAWSIYSAGLGPGFGGTVARTSCLEFLDCQGNFTDEAWEL